MWVKYGKTYCKEWEQQNNLKDWIKPMVGDISQSHVGTVNLKYVHISTDKHKKNAQPFSSMHLTDIGFTVSKSCAIMRQTELKLACYVACHTEVSSVDHRGELVGSGFEKEVNLHCTQCMALINNAIAPCTSAVFSVALAGANLDNAKETNLESTKQVQLRLPANINL